MATLLLALRGAAAVAVLTSVVGGFPRVVQLGLAVVLGLWSALLAPALGPAVALDAPILVAAHELVIGATIGLLAALPLLAAAAAGRLVDVTMSTRRGPYASLFAVLAGAVFVGIDGHVTLITAVVDSFRAAPAIAPSGLIVQPSVLSALGGLVPSAVALAIPWIVTAAVVELAIGAGVRVAGRAGSHAPVAAAVPAALVMITAALIATLGVAIAALVRGAL